MSPLNLGSVSFRSFGFTDFSAVLGIAGVIGGVVFLVAELLVVACCLTFHSFIRALNSTILVVTFSDSSISLSSFLRSQRA